MKLSLSLHVFLGEGAARSPAVSDAFRRSCAAVPWRGGSGVHQKLLDVARCVIWLGQF
ncbi:MAG: hypothetical protein Unbinned400contig1002_37 [Prokaryotic dsDNA virus sp.]|nr:MAG: hypothetical protein Unbinned400contig1002_37 [Prokaryotic dsDNA virus sp.]